MTFLLVLYFTFLILFLFWANKSLDSKSLFLFRSIFPNWKFFDQIGPLPRLYFRLKMHDSEGWRDWESFHSPQVLRLRNIFVNSEINLALFQQSLVHQLLGDLSSLSEAELEESSSYRLVHRLILNRLYSATAEIKAYQFQIRAVDYSEVTLPFTEILTSPIYLNESLSK